MPPLRPPTDSVAMAHDDITAGARVQASADAHGLFGQVMGLVAVTIGFTALGAYIGRDLSGIWGIAAFIGALACVFGLNAASRRSEPLALTLLFGLGLLLGLVLGPGLQAWVSSDPAAVWQAAGATALFIAALGSYGWARRSSAAGRGTEVGGASAPGVVPPSRPPCGARSSRSRSATRSAAARRQRR